MSPLMPKTVAVSDIQKNYRKIFNTAKRTKEPVIVLSGNKPDVAIMDYKFLEELRKKLYELEVKDALEAIEQGEKELRARKTKVVKSLANLLDENK